MNHTYQTTNQTSTTRTIKTTISTWVSPLTQILCSYNWDNANSRVLIFKFCHKLTNFVHFIHHQFVHFIDPEKPVRGLMSNFVHFIHLCRNPLASFTSKIELVLALTLENAFHWGFFLKPTERAWFLVKNCFMDFQNRSLIERSICFYVTISKTLNVFNTLTLK